MGRAPVPVSPDDKNMSWALIPVCGVAEYGIGPANLILRSNLVSREWLSKHMHESAKRC